MTRAGGDDPQRPRRSDDIEDPPSITPIVVDAPIFDDATVVDTTDRHDVPAFDDPTEDEGHGQEEDEDGEETTTVGGGSRDELGAALGGEEATAAAHRGARPGVGERQINRWASTVMGQGPPPPTAEEIEQAHAAEAAARAEESSSQSDAPSTKKRARFFSSEDPPRRMGRYELIAEIASGGMATVFLARLRGAGGFQRFVAIKRLHPHLQHEDDFIQMFLDEARIAAQIHHAHVVPILEIGSSEPEGYYLVMEYIEGVTLYDVAANAGVNKLTVPRGIALRIVLDTLSGLHAAHELADANGHHLKVVHRDCTPSNMLVGVDGSTRLTDFGVARAASRLSSTVVGTLKGKVAYMAPEQVKRADYDHRADVFSMGIILWELLTGKRLFRAETKMETLNRVMTAPIPRVSSLITGVSTALDDTAARALARVPDERFQTATEMAEALEKAAGVIIASPRQVAEFVQQLFGKDLTERRDAIRRWTDASDGGEPVEVIRRGRPSSIPPAKGYPSSPPGARAPQRTPLPPRASGGRDAGGSKTRPDRDEAAALGIDHDAETMARKLAPNEPTVAKRRTPSTPDVRLAPADLSHAIVEAPAPVPASPVPEPIQASRIIPINPNPQLANDEPPTPQARRIDGVNVPPARGSVPRLPEHRVSLSPAVVASLEPPTPPPDTLRMEPQPPPESQLGMHRLEPYTAYEPTLLKARPKATRDDDIRLPTRSLAGYVFVAVVAVAVAAALLLGWTRWQDQPAPTTPTAAPDGR